MGRRIPIPPARELLERQKKENEGREETMPSVKEPNQQDSQPPGPESPTTESNETPRPVRRTEVDVLQSLVDEYKTRNSQNACVQRRNFRLGVITAVLVFAYTTVAALQWCATQEANRIAQNALISADRPWVGIDTIRCS
jgi:hypothetical protein